LATTTLHRRNRTAGGLRHVSNNPRTLYRCKRSQDSCADVLQRRRKSLVSQKLPVPGQSCASPSDDLQHGDAADLRIADPTSHSPATQHSTARRWI